MLTIRKANQRGHANHGWLDTYHSFSFGNYYDPAQMGFRSLRVINEDRIQGGGGFPPHDHQNMEILTWVLEGALEHKDSTGGGGIIRPGTMQHMTAGSGITHSEFNHSPDLPVHLYQIWLLPREKGLKAGYKDQTFDPAEWQGRFRTLASPDGRDHSLTIQQDALVSVTELGRDQVLTQAIDPARHAWLQVTRGRFLLNGQELEAGDGAALSEATGFNLSATEPGQVLWFDLI